jgi:toxoflavin biosynthesis protein ToxC
MRMIDVGFSRRARETGREGHRSPITCLEIAPDGERIATGSYDGTVKLWELPELRVVATFWHARLVNGLRWSHDGSLLASGSADHTCRVWDTATEGCVAVLARHPDDVNTMAWSPDDSRLVTVSEDGTGRLWSVADERLEDVVLCHADHLMSVDWNAATDTLATCGEDATIRLWDGRGRPIGEWPQAGDLEMCRWSPDGRRLAAACDDGNARVFDEQGECVGVLGPAGVATKSVGWSPDGRFLVVGAYDGSCTVWNVAEETALARFRGPRVWPRALHWSPAGDVIALGCLDEAPVVVDAPQEMTDALDEVAIPAGSPTHGVNSMAIVPDEAVLLASDDGLAWRWELSAPSEEGPENARPLPGQTQGTESLLNTIAYEPARRLVAYGTFAGTVTVRELDSGRVVLTLDVGVPVNSVAWSPNGTRLAVGTYEGEVVIATVGEDGDASPARRKLHDAAIKSVTWVTDELLATGATDRLVRISTPAGDVRLELSGHGNLIDSVAVTRGADRLLLASTSRDRTIRIWDLETGRCERVLLGHDESLKSVAWKPGSDSVLLSGSYDFDARVWDLSLDEADAFFSVVLRHHRHGVGAVGWWGDMPVTASWDTTCVLWQRDAGGEYRPERIACLDALVRHEPALVQS